MIWRGSSAQRAARSSSRRRPGAIPLPCARSSRWPRGSARRWSRRGSRTTSISRASHPLYGGVVTDGIDKVVGEADAVLLVEAVLPWHPPSSLPRAGTKVFAIGEDPLRAEPAVLGLPHRPGRARRAQVHAGSALGGPRDRRANGIFQRRNIEKRNPERPISTAWVAQELNEVLPKDAIVVNETITHRLELLRRLTRLEPGGFYEASFGGLGTGLATALGVKHAHPQRVIVCTIGDGAFHYNPVVASFGAAQEFQSGMVVMIFNNAGYLSQKMDVAMYHPQGAAVKSGRFAGTSIAPRPDYTKLAQAYGGWGEKSRPARRAARRAEARARAGGARAPRARRRDPRCGEPMKFKGRREDDRLLTGQGKYTSDWNLPGPALRPLPAFRPGTRGNCFFEFGCSGFFTRGKSLYWKRLRLQDRAAAGEVSGKGRRDDQAAAPRRACKGPGALRRAGGRAGRRRDSCAGAGRRGNDRGGVP